MTTSSRPDPERPAASSAVPPDALGRVFAEPWQAQAFALAVLLAEHGHFEWSEWSAALGRELNASAQRGAAGDGSHYYYDWLATLERLVIEKGLADRAALDARKDAWADAYRHTPHGQVVELP